MLLLGKEQYNPKWKNSDSWCAFGGRRERGETYEETAAREFYEETGGVICSMEDMKQRLQNNEYLLYIDVVQSKSSIYRLYLVQVPYGHYSRIYSLQRGFLSYIGQADKLEKSYIQWFTLDLVQDAAQNRWTNSNYYGRKPRFLPRFTEAIRSLASHGKLQLLREVRPDPKGNNNSGDRGHYHHHRHR